METRIVESKRYIFIVSDATGKTCTRVVNAALRQFKTTEAKLEIVNFIRTNEQIDELIDRVARVNGIVVHTMVSPEARQRMTEQGRLKGVPTVDLLGPLLTRFSDLLEISPLAQPGLDRQLDDDYFRRIEAIDFTIKHDDSMGLATLDQAEVVVLGVSRTTKTPVCIYLSYRGWKAANIPIIMDYPLPSEVFGIDQRKILALTVKPSRLQLIRLDRQLKLKNAEMENYTDPELVKAEVNYALDMYRKHGYPVVDVTYKSIEETATDVMRIIYSRMGIKKGRFVP
ncbi:MAG: kinase/pyrophosphorylase [Candidatus Aminicenantes bacterium]|nr:MAG: kinase/pyrophosphorylase [Candidatus Aminicenantes bacterium]